MSQDSLTLERAPTVRTVIQSEAHNIREGSDSCPGVDEKFHAWKTLSRNRHASGRVEPVLSLADSMGIDDDLGREQVQKKLLRGNWRSWLTAKIQIKFIAVVEVLSASENLKGHDSEIVIDVVGSE
ncbi:uncharacterized protein RSE6_12751 [Rhynchosporium secalis]|uniref:Uncharacterized protein n=1 Tax=Rhynchosporium secalis TaxID=38038 RepID=A0A1E1MR86_RHYSE|nr:uncharacterized protein RSE6_12751 [Rhynchosporium secalis]